MIKKYFGEKFNEREVRIISYEYLETFIRELEHDWANSPDTDSAVKAFLVKLDNFTNQELAFLICHTGFIPELYGKDSSQETLYTKLIETVVLVWAQRMGFNNSDLPTQKSSKEDVTIMDEKHVIVCDAKSFRLGRSQAAPNVKDTLKSGDIKKWLSNYTDKICLGGLVTFPSQHDWQKGSDYYQYLTDKTNPTLSLFYEQISLMLLSENVGKDKLINTYLNFSQMFPERLTNKSTNKSVYIKKTEDEIFGKLSDDLKNFKIVAREIISECVMHTLNQLDTHINTVQETIRHKYYRESDMELLRSKVIDSEQMRETSELQKQRTNIKKFRTPSDGYID